MSSYRKLAAGSLVFAILAVMLMVLSFSFVQRLPESLHGSLTDWIYMSVTGVFGLVAALYCALAYGLTFRVIDDPSVLGDASSTRVIKRLAGFYVPGSQQADLLLINRAGKLWLMPSAPQSPDRGT